jgi:hypothetical protein
MLKVKLIAENNMDDHAVTLEINDTILICFAFACPYKIYIGKYYPIELSLERADGVKPIEIDKEVYGFEKIGKGYEYIVRGKLNEDRLDVGNFFIQEDFLTHFPLLDEKFIEIEVLGLWVAFLPQS